MICSQAYGLLFAILVSLASAYGVDATIETQRVPLWAKAPGAVSGEDSERNPKEPTIDLYLVPPTQTLSAAVILFPGGGYGDLATDYEGSQMARFFNQHGISAFVVRYRHAPRYHFPIPLEDALRAIRLVRSRAAEFHVLPGRIGVMGFSAGGHLASMVATRFDAGNAQAIDPVDRVSSRPDFVMLIYPVITLSNEPFVHAGSRTNLIGTKQALARDLSSELHVRSDTPSAFLVHGGKDSVVPSENSLLFYTACRQAGVPAELHLYEQGEHGLLEPSVQTWKPWAIEWMQRNHWLEP